MSATLSATTAATSQATSEWVRLFPRQVTETYTSSVTFMKQLTVVAVSTITYLKNIFPEESYTVENFGGVKLRILKKKCRDELAQFVSTGLIQAFEAFDQKYLHQLALCFYDGRYHEDNLVESHVFEFTYGAGAGVSVRSRSRGGAGHDARYEFDSIRERTVHLVRSCVVIMETCHYALPASCDISLRLYYNEDAPEGYQAPGFVAAPEGEPAAPAGAACVKLGWVETPFHRLAARSYLHEDVASSREANASQNAPMMTQNEDEEFCSDKQLEATSDGSAAPLRCPCDNYNGGDELAMISCDYCKTMQHITCFGLTRDMAARVVQHCCTYCYDEDPTRKPTDTRLAELSVKKRESLCIFRRALQLCGSHGAAGARGLAERLGLSRGAARKLVCLLRAHGVLQRDGGDDLNSPRKVIPEQLATVMSKFFQTEENDMVDRLLAESLSQGSQSDPVGDVLAPMDKVSLHNATAVGKIIQHTPPETATEDSTLKQYREAILSSDQQMDEQLPLSGSHNPVKNMEKIGKKTNKRKIDPDNRQLRSGVKTKIAKVMPE